MNHNNDINEIDLLQYVKNELTEERRLEVEEWMNSSEENKKMAEDFYYLSFAITSFESIKRSAPQKALEKVNKRIDRKTNRHNLLIRLQKVAAILTLPLLILSSYLLFEQKEKQDLFYLEARMTPGMVGSTVLPDGTKVWLNSSSYLRYPSVFTENSRDVELDGEAYFKVTKDKNKPFIVHTQNSSVKVLGTEFNIDAYSYNDFVATTLVEGSVEFSYNNKFEQAQTMLLKPNEQALYDKKTYQAAKKETYVPKDIAWRNGQIVLKETPLSDILWTLSKRFNVEFVIKDPALYKQSYTGIFTYQQLERVLEHFKRASGIRYNIDHQLDKDGEIIKSRVELF